MKGTLRLSCVYTLLCMLLLLHSRESYADRTERESHKKPNPRDSFSTADVENVRNTNIKSTEEATNRIPKLLPNNQKPEAEPASGFPLSRSIESLREKLEESRGHPDSSLKASYPSPRPNAETDRASAAVGPSTRTGKPRVKCSPSVGSFASVSVTPRAPSLNIWFRHQPTLRRGRGAAGRRRGLRWPPPVGISRGPA